MIHTSQVKETRRQTGVGGKSGEGMIVVVKIPPFSMVLHKACIWSHEMLSGIFIVTQEDLPRVALKGIHSSKQPGEVVVKKKKVIERRTLFTGKSLSQTPAMHEEQRISIDKKRNVVRYEESFSAFSQTLTPRTETTGPSGQKKKEPFFLTSNNRLTSSHRQEHSLLAEKLFVLLTLS